MPAVQAECPASALPSLGRLLTFGPFVAIGRWYRFGPYAIARGESL
jgi:hypothetical protein